MVKRNRWGDVPAAWSAAAEVLAEPLALPDPMTLNLLEWPRRVPEYLGQVETLAEALGLLRPGQPVGIDDRRLIDELIDRLAQLRHHAEAMRAIVDQRADYPETFDLTQRSPREWRREHALSHWRLGERQLRQPDLGPLVAEYEAAIARLLTSLQSVRTLDELVATYFGDSGRAWLREAVASDPNETRIWHVIVLDVACWRRARQLVADRVIGPVNEDA